MRAAIPTVTSRAAGKLRAEELDTAHIAICIQTNPHRRQDGWYAPQISITCEPTNDTFALVGHATRLLKVMWKNGYRYAKAGVSFNDLAPTNRQNTLFATGSERTRQATKAMDAVNQRFGKGTMSLLSSGLQNKWQPRQGMLSQCYTTNINEIMEARTF